MTSPTDAHNEDGARYYLFQDEKYYSVTTILNAAFNKPALPGWAAKQAAVYAVENWKMLTEMMLKKQEKDVVRLISTQHKRTVERSQTVGDEVHSHVEDRVRGGKPQKYVPDHMKHYEAWCSAYKPDFIASEATVYNQLHRYAGTLDMLASIDGVVTVIDVKTGNNIYPEVALQLAAYRYADFIGRDGEKYDLPTAEKAAVLHLRPNGYKFHEVLTGPEVFRYFLTCVDLYGWQSLSKQVILNS